jgi:hypothetical protein
MDARRFDLLARGFARLGSRRTLMRSMLVAAGGSLTSVSAARALDATGATGGIGGSDGTTICPPTGRPTRKVTGVAPFPAFIIGGSCSDLDESVRYNLIDVGAEAPDGDPEGASSAIGVYESMTAIRVPLADLLDGPHAVVVRAGSGNDALIACGDIGGALRGDALALGLRERNGSGYAGVAKLTAADSQTSVDIYVAQDLFDTDQSWEGLTVVTTIDVNLRDQASEDGGVIIVLGEGTELLVTGEPIGVWLPVEVVETGETGYISAEFIEAQ